MPNEPTPTLQESTDSAEQAQTGTPQTLDQLRASFSWDRVSAVSSPKTRESFRDLIRSFPSMIQTSGLGQTLAFLSSGGQRESAKERLYQILQEWLCDNRRIYTRPDRPSSLDLLVLLSQGSSLELRQATREALALSQWLKRFAEALEQQEKQAALEQRRSQAGDRDGT